MQTTVDGLILLGGGGAFAACAACGMDSKYLD